MFYIINVIITTQTLTERQTFRKSKRENELEFEIHEQAPVQFSNHDATYGLIKHCPPHFAVKQRVWIEVSHVYQ